MGDEVIHINDSAAKVQRLLGLNNQQWELLKEQAQEVNKEMLTDENRTWLDPTNSWTDIARTEKDNAIRILRQRTLHEFRVDIHPATINAGLSHRLHKTRNAWRRQKKKVKSEEETDQS